MTVAVDDLRDSIDAWREGQQDRLVLFIKLDAALTIAAAPFVFTVYATVARESYLLICGIAVGVGALLMFRGARSAARGDLSSGVAWLAAGNYVAIVVGAILAQPVWPIFPLASLLPAIVAASYVRQDQFIRYLIASVVVATATTMLGIYSSLTTIEEDVPRWVTDMLQAVFVPLMTASLGFLAVQNFGRVRSIVTSLFDAHDAMRFQANDLLASRSRMLEATDRERRRIERDLHDGTQQHFVAMGMRLGAVKALLPESAVDVHAEVDRLRTDVREAQRDLRELTTAIYPPALTQHGLSAALRSVAGRYSGNVVTDIAEVGRCEPSVEAAVYFVCTEALQNAGKHAGDAATVRLHLDRTNNELRFEVSDDGVGFVVAAELTSGGTTNMHDRIGAVLGHLSIDSTPGGGTRVTGVVPVLKEAH